MGDEHRRRLAAGEAAIQASPSATFRAVSRPVRLASEPPDVTSPANLPGWKAERFADGVDHRVFDGGRPGAHFVNRHRLVRDRADQIEQRGQRHRRRHLMADVVRVVEVLAAGERFAGEFGEAVRNVALSRTLPWPLPKREGNRVVQPIARFARSASAGSFQLSTLASRDSTRRKCSASVSMSRCAGRFERGRVVGGGDARAGGGEVVRR